MNKLRIKKIIHKYLVLMISVIAFVGFGLCHIDKFETSDEHFWRLERVPQYWSAISSGDLKQTYINDKPGVSVALISGIGLPFVSQETGDYKSKKDFTMTLNRAMRLPILLFNGLVMLPIIFWLLTRAFDRRVASISIILIGLNPILIGISQIINPDALLWSFSTAAILSFFALLKLDSRLKDDCARSGKECHPELDSKSGCHPELDSGSKDKSFLKKKNWDGIRKTLKNNPAFIFTLLTGIFTGFALLSKYSANLLFVFYLIISATWLLFNEPTDLNIWLRNFIKRYFLIWFISIIIFIIFLPAVLFDIDLFTYGTIFSPALKPILIPILILLLLLIIDTYLLKSVTVSFVLKWSRKINKPLLMVASVPIIVLFVFALINALLGAKFVPLNNLKEIVADTQTLTFPMFEGLPPLLYFLGEIAIQSFNTIFSLSPIIVLTVIFLLPILLIHINNNIFATRRDAIANRVSTNRGAILFFVVVPFIFFVGGIVSEVFVNTRYAIILQVTFAILVGIIIANLQPVKRYFGIVIITIFLLQGIILYSSAPHYFNYQNIFLPKKFVLTDSWSYGIFEAVEYLNSLPNADDLTIWSDRKAACYYFKGNCIMRCKIDAKNNMPDYFVLTRRGVVRHHFKWLKPSDAPYFVNSVYTDEVLGSPLWQYNILGRKQNYIKIIDAHKVSDTNFAKQVEQITIPLFSNNTCNITDYGAKTTLTQKQLSLIQNPKNITTELNNEKQANTKAINSAVSDCAKHGGGTVFVPSGIWFVGGIKLVGNINLHLDDNATILFSNNADDYLPPVKTRFVGLDVYNYSPFIYIADAKNIAITGRGTIDGQGMSGDWENFIDNQRPAIKELYKMSLSDTPIEERIFASKKSSLRPSLIQFYNSQNILIDGITIKGGPMWTIHPVYSKNIIITNTTIKTTASNGDGIALDSVENALIKDNTLSTSDDAIVLKSGRDKEGWTRNKPTKNIVIKNNTVTKAHAGIAIGSEMSGNVYNVLVDNLTMSGINKAFRIKTLKGRGGFVKNIIVQNLKITDPKQNGFIDVNMTYGSRTLKPKTKKLPQIYDIRFSNIEFNISNSNPNRTMINVEGFKDKKSNLQNIIFKDIRSNIKLETQIKNAKNIFVNE